MSRTSQTNSTSSVTPITPDNLGSPLVALPSFHEKLKGITLYCKRDDLFTPFIGVEKPSEFYLSALTGNKARKLYSYLNFFTPRNLSEQKPSVASLVSYGGLQSNAMVALSELARLLKVPFYYYAKNPPRSFATFARSDNHSATYDELSNFEKAKTNGMVHIPAELGGNLASRYQHMISEHPQEDVCLFLEGAASPWCAFGYELLAKELFADLKKLSSKKVSFHGKELEEKEGEGATVNLDEVDIVLTAGTGLSGYMLKRALFTEANKLGEKKIPQVFIAPVVSSINKKSKPSYMRSYLNYLSELLKVLKIDFEAAYYPREIYPAQHYAFARPHPELYKIFVALQEHTSITFDLLYDTVGWLALLENNALFKNRTVVYIHQGGAGGNVSLLRRYRYLGLLG